MSIYDVDYSFVWEQLMVPVKRLAKQLAWGRVLMTPLQWLRDTFFDDYADGLTYTEYNVLTAYVIGDKFKWSDKGLYICIVAPPAPGTIPTDTAYFYQISKEYIGLRKRANFNGQKKVLEYALNKHFSTTFNQPPTDSEIFLVTNVTDVNYFVSGVGAEGSSTAAYSGATALSFVGESYSYNAYELTINVPNTVLAALAGESSPYPNAKNAVLSYANKFIFAGIQAEVVGY